MGASSEELSKVASETKVIISFGAKKGGFPFVHQLRHDLYRKFQRDSKAQPRFVYLDAYSLEGLSGSEMVNATGWKNGKEVGLDFARFINPNWHDYFNAAMSNSRTMIFLISKHWLKSPWCWQELDMFQKWTKTNKSIRPIAVLFPDALPFLVQKSMESRKMYNAQKQVYRETIQPKRLLETLRTVPGYVEVAVKAHAPEGFDVVLPSGEDWHYETDYVTSEAELNKILDATLIA